MSQIVVDTDVASYIFNWHSLAKQYAEALCGSELILSFMSVAELRMGAMSAGWGSNRRRLLERFVHGFELFYPDNDLCTVWARIRADARANWAGNQSAGRLDRGNCLGVGRTSRNQQSPGFRERPESPAAIAVTISLRPPACPPGGWQNHHRAVGMVPPADARHARRTRQLAVDRPSAMSVWIARHGLKQSEAAEILMASRPRVSDVVNKKTAKFTIDT